VIKQVERSVLQSSDWFPEARNENQKMLKLALMRQPVRLSV